MSVLHSLQVLLISAVMAINPLLLPSNLRTTNKPATQISEREWPVQCQITSLCGGDIKTLKRWECEAAVCCNNNGKWELHYDGQKCEVLKPTPTQPIPVQPKVQQPVSASNKGNCVGPDNKVMSLTQKECEDFNRAWGKPSNWVPAGGVVTIDCLLFDGDHILSDPQTCDDFNNRKFNPEANKQNNNNVTNTIPTEPTYPCTVSYSCTGSVKTYQLTTADCLSFQNLAWETCKPSAPITLPPIPKREEFKPNYPTVSTSDFNQNWPTIGPSVPQFPQKCEAVGNSTVVICQ